MPQIHLIEQSATVVPAVAARELASHFPQEFRIVPGWGTTATVTPLGIVGELDVAGTRWVITPKFPADVLAHMIHPTMVAGTAGDSIPCMPNLVAGRLIELIDRTTLKRNYTEVAEWSASIRGRIDFPELARTTDPSMGLPIRADDFTLDQPANQATLAAIDRLLMAPLTPLLRQQLQRTRQRYAGVTSRVPGADEWPNLALNAGAGGELLAWSRMILTGLNAGGYGYLMRLETVFERYVMATLTQRLPTAYRVTRPKIPLQSHYGPAIVFQPDCVVEHHQQAVSVWDAKWKRLKRSGPNSADVQQILAYAMLLGVRAFGLVYPGHKPSCMRYQLPQGILHIIRLTLKPTARHTTFLRAAQARIENN